MNRFDKIRQNQQMVLMLSRNLPQGTYAQVAQAIKATEGILQVLENALANSLDKTLVDKQLESLNTRLEQTVAELEKLKNQKKKQSKTETEEEET